MKTLGRILFWLGLCGIGIGVGCIFVIAVKHFVTLYQAGTLTYSNVGIASIAIGVIIFLIGLLIRDKTGDMNA